MPHKVSLKTAQRESAKLRKIEVDAERCLLKAENDSLPLEDRQFALTSWQRLTEKAKMLRTKLALHVVAFRKTATK